MKQKFQLSVRAGTKKLPGATHSTQFPYSYDISLGEHPYSRVMSIEISSKQQQRFIIPLMDAFNEGLITIETTTLDYEKTNPELKKLHEAVRKKRREAPTTIKTITCPTRRG